MRYIKLLGILSAAAVVLTGCNDAVRVPSEVGTGMEEGASESAAEGASEDAAGQTESSVLEQLELGDLTNLDLTDVPDEIALPDEMYVIESQGEGSEWTDEKIYEDFPRLLEAYGGPSKDELDPEKDILLEIFEDGNFIYPPLEERDGLTFSRIVYSKEQLYLEMTSVCQIMTYQPDVVGRITGSDYCGERLWMPNDVGNPDPIATYYAGKDDFTEISYVLDGEEVTLAEAVEFLEDTLTENEDLPCLSTPGMEYRVEYVDVYQYGDNYGYYFTVDLYYKGIELDAEPGDPTEGKVDGKKIAYNQDIDRCVMLQKDRINAIYNFDLLKETPDSIEKAELNVDYGTALQILSGYLSRNHVFKVLDAKLVYGHFEVGEADRRDAMNYIVPTWKFEISAEGSQEYERLFVSINIQTGEAVRLWGTW